MSGMDAGYVSPAVGRPVGEGLRRARRSAGLSQGEVARRSGVARPNIAAIEGGTRVPSPEMTGRLLDAIRGRTAVQRALHLSPPVLLNIEMARVAAFRILDDPPSARAAMVKRLAVLRARENGGAEHWLNDWAALLDRWDVAEVVGLLLSTDPDDVERRKVSPLDAIVSDEEAAAALERARRVWRATR
jgi:transcriptional regulator with XRE-family HTH domain